ncbi:hypothetical protein KOE80_19135 [Alcaligenes sp. 13f]|uniref:hypothetical protein n=1 Tax=Alcaligenes sp. 13f TaxID=2841924 RepID=UPI001CF60754|nr:hypothetical protein [Alcaligenes sp. 13f]MCB4324322.1 hypothetical protein [Alcaligenes sp. 13f]
MKHTTKRAARTSPEQKTQMIGLRLPPAEMAQVRELAAADERPLAQFARICFRMGLEQMRQGKKE